MKSEGDAVGSSGTLKSQIHSTLENLIEGAQIIDREWRYVYVNPAAARHGGSSVEELVGRTMFEAYPGIDQTAIFGVLREVMETGVATEIQTEFVLPDGEHRWFELLIHAVPEGLFVLSLDITERRVVEEELRATRARMEAIIENLDQGLLLADLDGNLLHVNRAALEMLGLSGSQEWQGPLLDLSRRFDLFTMDGIPVPPEERPLARVIRGEHFRDAEFRVARKDQQWQRTLSYNGTRIHYGDGQMAALVTIDDVTERKELARKFVAAQRLETVGALAGGIAHDLNNVLMPILMGTGLLRNLPLGDRGARTVDTIERSARRGADLVKQVLSFARGSAGTRSVVDVRVILAEVDTIMRSTFPKDITVALEIPNDRYLVLGDPTLLVQMVLSLCVHARDAMPGGGRLTVAVGKREIGVDGVAGRRVEAGPYVEVQVRDEGLAIPPEVLAHLFESAGGSETSAASFGLFTVQEIVRGHGGFVDVASATGKGTTFNVYLPAEGVSGAVNDVEPAPRGNGQLILVVDDEPSILTIVEQTLEAYGYEVLTAEDGAQAVALYAARRSEIALVLTDMMMPVLAGTALISALLHMNPGLRIIATSGTQAHDWKARAQRAGARHFLAKPYSAPVLLRLVASVLAAEP